MSARYIRSLALVRQLAGFFEGDAVASKKSRKRALARSNVTPAKLRKALHWCQVWMSCNHSQYFRRALLHWRNAAAARLRRSAPVLAPTLQPLDRRTHTHPETFSRLVPWNCKHAFESTLIVGFLASLIVSQAVFVKPLPVAPLPPSIIFGDLFSEVQIGGLFLDSKTFADAIPKYSQSKINADYRAHKPADKTQLEAFVRARFELPSNIYVARARPGQIQHSLPAQINALWPNLKRAIVQPKAGSSELPLWRPFIVPGGRFREMYYWDSYFSMLGLVRDGYRELVVNMVDNFADMIKFYGCIPNGARSYYLTRSQPPVFYLMVGLTADDPVDAYVKYLPALRREYRFWMRGEQQLKLGQMAPERVVRLKDGAILNRYWDDVSTPRDESYREDVALAAHATRPAPEVYRDIRAAAESGWDFSSRWLADDQNLTSIQTTKIVPVDLNSLLFGLERAIAQGCGRIGDRSCVEEFDGRASQRQFAVLTHLWDPRRGEFLDYHWQRDERLDRTSAATVYPLFVGLAGQSHASVIANVVQRDLLAPGGLRTTKRNTGQQWDAPNGWAPLQWIAVLGLHSTGQESLAREIAIRWLSTVCRIYVEEGKLLEKYDVETIRPGGGGEYPLQDGFGWTNGVTRALLELYHQTVALTSSKPLSIITSRAVNQCTLRQYETGERKPAVTEPSSCAFPGDLIGVNGELLSRMRQCSITLMAASCPRP